MARRAPVSTRRRTVAVAALSILFVAAGAGVALADDGEYTPRSLSDLLFPSSGLSDGLAPTLYEAYPDGAYYFDYVDSGDFLAIIDNAFSPALNDLANVFFGLTRILVKMSINVSTLLSGLVDYSGLVEGIQNSVGSVASSFNGWLLPSTLVIGGIVILSRLGSEQGRALNDIAFLLLGGVLSVGLALFPAVYVERINAVREATMQSTVGLSASVTSDLHSPITGPTPVYSSDAARTGMRKMGDAIWRTYVVTPWCIGEFGNLDACQRWGEGILSRPLTGDDARRGYITGTVQDEIGGHDSEAYQMLTGHSGAARLTTAFFSLIPAGLFAILELSLCLLVAFNLILAMMMLMMGGIFLPLMCIPGLPRSWTAKWVSMTFGFLIISALAGLVLTATLAVNTAAVSMTSEFGPGVSALLAIASSVAAFTLMGHLRSIFGISTTGVGRIAGGLFGAAMTASYLRRGLFSRRAGGAARRARSSASSAGGRTAGGAGGATNTARSDGMGDYSTRRGLIDRTSPVATRNVNTRAATTSRPTPQARANAAPEAGRVKNLPAARPLTTGAHAERRGHATPARETGRTPDMRAARSEREAAPTRQRRRGSTYPSRAGSRVGAPHLRNNPRTPRRRA